jgi:hypothetical protein
MSLEMAHKVILPPKKNYIPQFLKQRDINSYSVPSSEIGPSYPPPQANVSPPPLGSWGRATLACVGVGGDTQFRRLDWTDSLVLYTVIPLRPALSQEALLQYKGMH